MRIVFVAPELRRLDAVKSDALSLCLLEEDWPLLGTPGLVDWRTGGHLSRLKESGWITCLHKEIVLMPLGRRLPFEKLLLVGMGPSSGGPVEERMTEGLHMLFETLGKMRVHSTVLHLPGRPSRVPPETAMRILLSVAGSHPDHDEVVVVEPPQAQRTMKAIVDGLRG